ncbi:MAG: hypothetical protein O7G29_03695 [Acidobacteria bacterium]|nr:hypothetical protein [Acidobacteriota bacterium]
MSSRQVLEYFSVLIRNRDFFLLNQRDAFLAFETIHHRYSELGSILANHRDKDGHSQISLIPFVLLMQRQAMAAFWSLACYQSHQAWVTLRPCLESALIIGKWFDDPDNASIWNNRHKDRTAFRRTYEGRALISESLPRAAGLQAVLRRINDDFMHTNKKYYERHTDVQSDGPDHITLLVHYFDKDTKQHRAHVLAFLHLMVVVQDSLAELWQTLFVNAPQIALGLSVFESQFDPNIREVLAEAPQSADILTALGLWKLNQEE